MLANLLGDPRSVDLNGVILLSQILSFDNSADDPQFNPGVDQAYVLALPTYAATAWYHGKLANKPAQLGPLLQEVENFALGAYAQALAEGSALPAAQQQAVAEKLHAYTGLPVDYWVKANLRVNGGQFEHELLNAGYFDLATPFFEGIYEMRHLPIPDALQKNIEFAFYPSGHMVYAHAPSLKQLHDRVAKFIAETDNVGPS